MDIIIIGIVILGLVIGKRRGVLNQVMRLFSILISLFCAVLLTGSISEFLTNSAIYDRILKHTLRVMSSHDGIVLNIFPHSLKNIAELLEKQGSLAIAQGFSGLAIEIISFILVALISWLLMILIRASVRRARESSPVLSLLDSLLGMALGLLISFILVCLILAFAIPLTTLIDPEWVLTITHLLDSSYLASYLYNHNPLLIFIASI